MSQSASSTRVLPASWETPINVPAEPSKQSTLVRYGDDERKLIPFDTLFVTDRVNPTSTYEHPPELLKRGEVLSAASERSRSDYLQQILPYLPKNDEAATYQSLRDDVETCYDDPSGMTFTGVVAGNKDCEDVVRHFYYPDIDATINILADGHGGKGVAEYVTKHYPDYLKDELVRYGTADSSFRTDRSKVMTLMSETLQDFLKTKLTLKQRGGACLAVQAIDHKPAMTTDASDTAGTVYGMTLGDSSIQTRYRGNPDSNGECDEITFLPIEPHCGENLDEVKRQVVQFGAESIGDIYGADPRVTLPGISGGIQPMRAAGDLLFADVMCTEPDVVAMPIHHGDYSIDSSYMASDGVFKKGYNLARGSAAINASMGMNHSTDLSADPNRDPLHPFNNPATSFLYDSIDVSKHRRDLYSSLKNTDKSTRAYRDDRSFIGFYPKEVSEDPRVKNPYFHVRDYAKYEGNDSDDTGASIETRVQEIMKRPGWQQDVSDWKSTQQEILASANSSLQSKYGIPTIRTGPGLVFTYSEPDGQSGLTGGSALTAA